MKNKERLENISRISGLAGLVIFGLGFWGTAVYDAVKYYTNRTEYVSNKTELIGKYDIVLGTSSALALPCIGISAYTRRKAEKTPA